MNFSVEYCLSRFYWMMNTFYVYNTKTVKYVHLKNRLTTIPTLIDKSFVEESHVICISSDMSTLMVNPPSHLSIHIFIWYKCYLHWWPFVRLQNVLNSCYDYQFNSRLRISVHNKDFPGFTLVITYHSALVCSLFLFFILWIPLLSDFVSIPCGPHPVLDAISSSAHEVSSI